MLDAFPERTPLLGYYREGDPSVMDWQIKWVVEHGISFFAFDWYWDRGRRQLATFASPTTSRSMASRS